MTKQEALNKLSELEEFFFYLEKNPGDMSEFYLSIMELHHNIRAGLEKWHRITGCTITR